MLFTVAFSSLSLFSSQVRKKAEEVLGKYGGLRPDVGGGTVEEVWDAVRRVQEMQRWAFWCDKAWNDDKR